MYKKAGFLSGNYTSVDRLNHSGLCSISIPYENIKTYTSWDGGVVGLQTFEILSFFSGVHSAIYKSMDLLSFLVSFRIKRKWKFVLGLFKWDWLLEWCPLPFPKISLIRLFWSFAKIEKPFSDEKWQSP